MKKNQVELEIVSRRESITAKAIVKGNTITLAYDKVNEQVQAVAFSVQRGTQQSPNFTPNEAFRGSVYMQAFNVENNTYQIGDAGIYEDIYAICQEIIHSQNENTDSL